MRSHTLITGLGPVSALGLGAEAFWESLEQGTPGVRPIESFDTEGFHVQIGGEVRDANIRDFVPKSYRKATKVMARDTELAVIAAKIASDDAGLTTRGSEEGDEGFRIDPARTGCQIGAGLIAAETEELARAVVSAQDEHGRFSMTKWGTVGEGEAGMNNLPPLWLLKYLPNMLACHVTIIHGLEGPSNTIMGAEASALLSIGESARVIERGSADICFTGGAESRINHLGLLRWEYAGRLAHADRDQDPAKVCKPYHPDSRGGLIGESGGMLVIEREQHAHERGRDAYARIVGFGAAQTPRPWIPSTGSMRKHDEIERGLAASITRSFHDAGLTPDDVDAVFTLGIGQPVLDAMELGAVRDALGDRAEQVPVASLTHLTGNTMAGHAGLLTAAGALCLKRGKIPAPMLTHNRDASPGRLRRVVVCSPSLGGQCAALVLEAVA